MAISTKNNEEDQPEMNDVEEHQTQVERRTKSTDDKGSAVQSRRRRTNHTTKFMMATERIMRFRRSKGWSSSLAREHSEEYKSALQRAVALDVHEAYSPCRIRSSFKVG